MNGSTILQLPVISDNDLLQVAQLISDLHAPSTSGNPELAHRLQAQLQSVISSDIAWSLLPGLNRSSQDPIVRFYAAQSAQTKIARDWESLPEGLRLKELEIVLDACVETASLGGAYSVVLRKLFSCIAGLMLRMTPHDFNDPILRVITILAGRGVSRTIILEFLETTIHDIGRAALVEPRKSQLSSAISSEMSLVVRTLSDVLGQPPSSGAIYEREMEQAFKTLEAWVGWGLTAEDLTSLLPTLYHLLSTPFLPSAVNVLIEILTASVFKDGKATKVLTEPLLEWITTTGQTIIVQAAEAGEGDSDNLIAVSKLVEAIVEHSAAWLAGRTSEPLVQSFLNVILRLSGFPGVASVDEEVSERTLALYSQIQEALVEDPNFQEAYETSVAWGIAKEFFREAVGVLQRKLQWPSEGVSSDDERIAFEVFRRDAGEVMVTAYYVLRAEMLEGLLQILLKQLPVSSPQDWQAVESTLHCIRYASEAVPLAEDKVLPRLFSAEVYGHLPRDAGHRVALTALRLMRSYEEWFKYHNDNIVFTLDYIVTALDNPVTAPEAATALKAICDICRGDLVSHVSAFGALHGKVSSFQPEEQVKVIEAIASVLQALPPAEAVDAVVTITEPIADKLSQCVMAAHKAPEAARTICMQQLQALTACAIGLTPSDEDMFDPEPEDTAKMAAAIETARSDPRLQRLRDSVLQSVSAAMETWSSDTEMANTLSSFVKAMTASASSQTIVSLASVPLLRAITTAAEKGINGLWLSLATTLIFRLAPAPGLRRLLSKAPDTAEQNAEAELKMTVSQATETFVIQTAGVLVDGKAVHAHPDVAEFFFKYASAVVVKFPSSFVAIGPQIQIAAAQMATLGLGAPERFTLLHSIEFLVAVLNTARHNPSIADAYEPVILANGQAILHATILGAGLTSPRSSIPNFAELLVALVVRIPNQTRDWLTQLLADPTFPGGKATSESKKKLQDTIMRVRTPKKIREALNDFALVCRGLAGTIQSASVSFDASPALSAPRTVKDGPGKDLLQRLNYVYQAQHLLAPTGHSNPSTFAAVARGTVLNVDPGVKRAFCKKCKAVLIPGLSAVVRVNGSVNHEHRIIQRCLQCDGLRSIPTPPLANITASPSGSTLDGPNRQRRKSKRTKPAAHWQVEASDTKTASDPQIKGKKAKNAGPGAAVNKRSRTRGHEVWQGDKRIVGWGVPALPPPLLSTPSTTSMTILPGAGPG